ncbi:MAG: hypothetical protein JO051_17455 [Acidobacteriaceae bacterium]|nr:hypothetical protein [Acidobacteriaceae bacterium]
MAAIGRNRAFRVSAAVCVVALISLGIAVRGAAAHDASSDARAQVTAVAEALSAGDAVEAMAHFSKSMPEYEKLKGYFEGLSAFQVENQLNITDEDDADTCVNLTIGWDITLTDLGTDRSRRRTGEIHVKLAPVDSKWRIVEFAPLDIFNPQVQ